MTTNDSKGLSARALAAARARGAKRTRGHVEKLRAIVANAKRNECLLWPGSLNVQTGYGQTQLAGRMMGAHRAIWIATRGPIPDGTSILHACDVRACVNPHHLFLGTQADNIHDMYGKGRSGPQRHPRLFQDAIIKAQDAKRAQMFCKQGHFFSPENTYRHPVTGRRYCRECCRASGRAYRARQRGAK